MQGLESYEEEMAHVKWLVVDARRNYLFSLKVGNATSFDDTLYLRMTYLISLLFNLGRTR